MTTDVFAWILSNLIVATALGLLATGLWLLRRPAAVHALCVLAMLKLVTPPLIGIPLWPDVAAIEGAPLVAPASSEPVADPEAAVTGLLAASAKPAPFEPTAGTSWAGLLAFLWVAGTCAILLRGARVGVRLRRDLRRMPRADGRASTALRRCAARLRLRRVPDLFVVDAAIAPVLLGAVGRRARILVPGALMAKLTGQQRDALLLHELAHYRRGDHLVRYLELLVTATFWWLPVTYWLRAMLRSAEEQCCDAWVVWAQQGNSTPYASALLATVDYLADGPLCPTPMGSGLGTNRTLKRRLTMILGGKTRRSLSVAGRLTVLAMTIAVLPCTLSRAQEPDAGVKQRLVEALRRIDELERAVMRMQPSEPAEEPASEAVNTNSPEDEQTLQLLRDMQMEHSFEDATVGSWTRFYTLVTGVPFAVVKAQNAGPRQYHLVDFHLPKMSVARALDVIAEQTGLSWQCRGGVVMLSPKAVVGKSDVAIGEPDLIAILRGAEVRPYSGPVSELRGLQVLRVDPQDSKGLRAGNVILSINGQPVRTKAEALTVTKRLVRDGERIVRLRLLDNGRIADRIYRMPDPNAGLDEAEQLKREIARTERKLERLRAKLESLGREK